MTERLGLARDLLLDRVGRKRRQQRAAAGQDAEQRAETGAACDRPQALPQVGEGRHHPADAGDDDLPLGGALFEVVDDLGDAKHAHGERGEADAFGEGRDAERKALLAGIDVGADESEQQADDHHRDGLAQRAARQHDRADQPEHHQREVVGGLEFQRDLRQRRREQRDHQRGDAAGDERRDRGHPERGAGAALFGHLVAVDGGDDR